MKYVAKVAFVSISFLLGFSIFLEKVYLISRGAKITYYMLLVGSMMMIFHRTKHVSIKNIDMSKVIFFIWLIGFVLAHTIYTFFYK